MKNYFISISMLWSLVAFSQVGINTEDPQVTLDVTASPDNENITDGFLVPRLTGDELKLKDDLYEAGQHGTLVYVTAIPDPATSKTSLITKEGFYYYDSNEEMWKTFAQNEPWNIRNTSNPAAQNSESIYQAGNVAVGTQYGQGAFHIDSSKNNTSNSANETEMLDDVMIHSSGRVYIGAKPNDILLLADKEDKIKIAANQDLDVDYDLATTSNSQAIVHRNIISSGTMAGRGARNKLTSITSFEGHTYQTPSFSNSFSWYQQRASIVLRTGRTLDDGGEIWFGTAGTPASYSGANPKVAWYRAVMDEKGYWAFGADPNNETYYAPTERLDVLYGGLRLRQLNTTPYTSTNSADRIVVVDANGVIKSKDAGSLLMSGIQNGQQSAVQKVLSNNSISSSTTFANAENGNLILTIENSQEFDGNKLIIKKIDQSNHSVTIKSDSNKQIDFANTYEITGFLSSIEIQYYDGAWFVIGKS